MSSVGMTFANRVLGLRLAPALQIDKAKVVPVFYSHSCQNRRTYSQITRNTEKASQKCGAFRALWMEYTFLLQFVFHLRKTLVVDVLRRFCGG